MPLLPSDHFPFIIEPLENRFLPTLLSWFKNTHVKEIWPLDEYSIQEVLKRYLEHEGSYIVKTVKGEAFGFFNTYKVEDFRDYWPFEPVGTIGFDYFIGEEKFLKQKLSIPMVQDILKYIFNHLNAKKIICDPPISHLVSQHILRTAGMNHIRNIISLDGACALYTLCQSPTLETKRLLVRLARPEDARSLLDLHLENDNDHFKTWSPTIPLNSHSEDYWKRIIAQSQSQFLKDISARFVFLEKEKSKIIGMMNYTSFERGPFQNCRLGYKIHKNFVGKGYTPEALQATSQYLFNFLHFHRIEANFIPENLASKRVLEKAGFKFIGTAEKYLKINGKWQDHILSYKNTHHPDSLFDGN